MKFQIKRFSEVSSTNTLAREFAEKKFKEGLVLVADYQTEGRGKPGRKWVSPPGKNLLFSVLIRPPLAPAAAPMLTQIACRSVAKVLKKDLGIDSAFKRPNDILVRGKKICGVLVESVSNTRKIESVVIGIGLNVNAAAAELVEGAVSLKEIKGKEIDRGRLLESLLARLKDDLREIYDPPT